MLTSRARRALGVVPPLVPNKAPNRCMGQLQGPALRRNPMRRATRHPLPHALAAELACKIHGKVLSKGISLDAVQLESNGLRRRDSISRLFRRRASKTPIQCVSLTMAGRSVLSIVR